jgi:type IV secretion/conjugal transfer VirB4 family ATPase
MQITEHRTHARGLADLLLPFGLIEDGILLQQDGSLLAAWAYRGPDMHSATHIEMEALAARFNSILRLGSGWMIHTDLIRSHAPGYPDQAPFPQAVTRVIDDERRQQFTDEGSHFESEHYLALTYLPPVQAEEKVKGWLFEGRNETDAGVPHLVLERFRSRLEMFENVFSSLFHVERLRRVTFEDVCGFPQNHDRLLRYLRRCIVGGDHPFSLPDIPVYLNEILASDDLCGGVEPLIGRKHVRVIALDGFPKTSFPGILGELDSLAMEYRWSTRAILLDPEEAKGLLDKTRKKWRSRIRGFTDQILRSQSGAVNLYAQAMAEDAELAMAVAASGDVQFAQYTSNIICMDDDLGRLAENVRTVMKRIQNLGFSCRLESVNAVEAWRGSIPGDGYRNVRRVLLHTLNLADMVPITAVWAGERQNPSRLMPKNSPPLLFGATTGATPFRVNLHVSDLGHTLMCGPSGAGKSTALGLIAAQWFRYPRAQIFAFDKGYSLFVLTKAAGGEFYDLAGENTDLAFCPLREIDSDADLTWAVTWLEDLCSLNGLIVMPKHRNALTQALQQLRLSPSRTLTELSANVQDLEVREALQFYTLSGPLGHLLDADEDLLSDGRFLTFETENLLQLDNKAVIPVLLYLFRRIEKRLDGSPTMVTLDEAWAYLRHPVFRERLRDWLKTLRRMNGIVLLATQNLSDICKSEISDVILEMCPTKILLPNAEAKNPASKEFYDRLGLNSREIEILQTSIPKQHYYFISPLGRRLISLGIHNVALSFIGVNGREERQLVEDLIEQFPDTWQSEWLRLRAQTMKDTRLAGWADYYEQIESQLERKHKCAIAS